mmetsp:Transcript_15600/g.51523  ORF Transcript_15600/g.51523 Transcript_15600/m.51523 type:complete len:252 (+) Transcript_15600:178-933(+)
MAMDVVEECSHGLVVGHMKHVTVALGLRPIIRSDCDPRCLRVRRSLRVEQVRLHLHTVQVDVCRVEAPRALAQTRRVAVGVWRRVAGIIARQILLVELADAEVRYPCGYFASRVGAVFEQDLSKPTCRVAEHLHHTQPLGVVWNMRECLLHSVAHPVDHLDANALPGRDGEARPERAFSAGHVVAVIVVLLLGHAGSSLERTGEISEVAAPVIPGSHVTAVYLLRRILRVVEVVFTDGLGTLDSVRLDNRL